MYVSDSGMYMHYIHSTAQFRKRSFCPGMLSAQSTNMLLKALDEHSTWKRKDDIVLALLTKQKLLEWS